MLPYHPCNSMTPITQPLTSHPNESTTYITQPLAEPNRCSYQLTPCTAPTEPPTSPDHLFKPAAYCHPHKALTSSCQSNNQTTYVTQPLTQSNHPTTQTTPPHAPVFYLNHHSHNTTNYSTPLPEVPNPSCHPNAHRIYPISLNPSQVFIVHHSPHPTDTIPPLAPPSKHSQHQTIRTTTTHPFLYQLHPPGLHPHTSSGTWHRTAPPAPHHYYYASDGAAISCILIIT